MSARSMDGSGPQVADALNLKALFEKFEVPWDETSAEIFARTLAKLEDHEKWRRWKPPEPPPRQAPQGDKV